MIEVLYFSDRSVKRKLFDRVQRTAGLVLVTAVRAGKTLAPPTTREPFVTLEKVCGPRLLQLVVADEGSAEGMWRDPVGELADALYPADRPGAYAAASGYLLFDRGEVLRSVKKRGDGRADAWHLQQALAAYADDIPPPAPRRRVTRPPVETAEGAPRSPLPADPYLLLGVARGCSLAEARKAFHALIAQYHPDKVAHLAVEFRALAEQRTRQILAAWEQVQREHRG